MLPTNEILNDYLINQKQEVKAALMQLALELANAELKHPRWPTDVIHRAAVVVEEAGELQRAALHMTYEHGSISEVIKEATHTGATSLRFLIRIQSLTINNTVNA